MFDVLFLIDLRGIKLSVSGHVIVICDLYSYEEGTDEVVTFGSVLTTKLSQSLTYMYMEIVQYTEALVYKTLKVQTDHRHAQQTYRNI